MKLITDLYVAVLIGGLLGGFASGVLAAQWWLFWPFLFAWVARWLFWMQVENQIRSRYDHLTQARFWFYGPTSRMQALGLAVSVASGLVGLFLGWA